MAEYERRHNGHRGGGGGRKRRYRGELRAKQQLKLSVEHS